MEFKDYTINFLLLSLFFIAIVSFAVSLGNGYGKSATDMRSEFIDTSTIEAQLGNASATINTEKEGYLKDNIFVASGAFVLNSVWGVIKSVFSIPIVMLSIYLQFAETILGIPALVTSVLTTIIIITLIFLGWRAMRQG